VRTWCDGAVKFNVFVELFKRNEIWRLVCKSLGVS